LLDLAPRGLKFWKSTFFGRARPLAFGIYPTMFSAIFLKRGPREARGREEAFEGGG
jgi:hypothetical protein